MRAGFLIALIAAGCSVASKPYRTAPVSGRVTLDGQPLAGARVTFLPVHRPQAGSLSGPEAIGDTDAQGRYTLVTVFDDLGASVGPHRVMITTRKTEPDPRDPERNREVAPERVPSKYFTGDSPIVFDVPAQGTSSANFDLTTR